MPKIYAPRTHWYVYLGLALLSTVPFLYLLQGQYLYDDVSHIEFNPQLNGLKSYSQVLGFKMQPSRPISSWTMAVAHLVGGGTLQGHRAVSLLLHCLTTLLLYFTVSNLSSVKLNSWGRQAALFVAVVFAIHPLQAEIIGVSSFRWEQWAAIATLLCMNLAIALSREDRTWLWYVLFSTLGLAFLSKETFSILAPIAVLSVFQYTGQLTRRNAYYLVGLCVPWALLLGCLLTQPTEYTYEGILGRGVAEWKQLIGASGNAFVEQVWKMFSGHKLVFLRLFERHGVLGPLSVLEVMAIFLAALGAWYACYREKEIIRLWANIFFSGSFLYLAIPNFNVGSQHYFYYLLISFFGLLAALVWKLLGRVSVSPVRLAQIAAVGLVLNYSGALSSRLFDLRSREAFNLAEFIAHPESPRALSLLVDQYRWDHKEEVFLPAEFWPPILDRYTKFPDNLYFAALYAEYLYAYGRLEEGYQKSIEVLEKIPASQRAAHAFVLAARAARAGDCRGTRELLARTENNPEGAYVPDPAALKAARQNLAKTLSKSPELCVRL